MGRMKFNIEQYELQKKTKTNDTSVRAEHVSGKQTEQPKQITQGFQLEEICGSVNVLHKSAGNWFRAHGQTEFVVLLQHSVDLHLM